MNLLKMKGHFYVSGNIPKVKIKSKQTKNKLKKIKMNEGEQKNPQKIKGMERETNCK